MSKCNKSCKELSILKNKFKRRENKAYKSRANWEGDRIYYDGYMQALKEVVVDIEKIENRMKDE